MAPFRLVPHKNPAIAEVISGTTAAFTIFRALPSAARWPVARPTVTLSTDHRAALSEIRN
jgi:hypothetical protein